MFDTEWNIRLSTANFPWHNNPDPHRVCRAAGVVQRNRLQRFLYLMNNVIDLKEKKNIKNKYIN